VFGGIESLGGMESAIEESGANTKVLENPLLINNPDSPSKSHNVMYNLVCKGVFENKALSKYCKKVQIRSKTTYFLNQIIRLVQTNQTFISCFVLVFLLSTKVIGQSDSTQYRPIKKVVIDAGHGGHDPGCLGADAREKHVCLGVALHLGKLIETYFSDVEVIYTRDEDVFVKLYERAEIANKAKADLFISIHANSAANPSAFGTETFVMGTKYTDANLEIAKRENSVIYLEDDHEENYDNSIVGFDPNSPMAKIVAGLLQQEYLHQSINFATKIEHQFELRNNRHSRGVKQRVLLVMYKTAMPSVLIETGFLTNKSEHDLLYTSKGQAETAGAIFRAFVQYKREMEGMTPAQIAAEENQLFKNWQKYYSFLIEDVPLDSQLLSQVDVVLPQEKASQIERNIQTIKKAEPLTDLIFKVQISSSNNDLAMKPKNFNGLDEISRYEDHGMYKYTYGNCADMNCAIEYQARAKEAGYTDAFVIAFYKGSRISIKRAKEILASQ
jgi:N-acetylmuramoyl-L-alanine amidase